MGWIQHQASSGVLAASLSVLWWGGELWVCSSGEGIGAKADFHCVPPTLDGANLIGLPPAPPISVWL